MNRLLENFHKEGFVIQDLYDINYLNKFISSLENNLKKITNIPNITLENFHKFGIKDDEKIKIHYELSELIWNEKSFVKIFEENINIYHNIIGKDLDIQVKPHLRIVRPNCPNDNIGFHRDTFYGNSAYEISNLIALVDLDHKSALQIEPASHLRGKIPYTKVKSKDVLKGSLLNKLGYPYEPKVIDENYKINSIAIPTKKKEVLIIGLGTIHGQEINTSNTTRWSIDVRIKNSFSKSEVKDDYYANLSSSVISKYARLHNKANNNEL